MVLGDTAMRTGLRGAWSSAPLLGSLSPPHPPHPSPPGPGTAAYILPATVCRAFEILSLILFSASSCPGLICLLPPTPPPPPPSHLWSSLPARLRPILTAHLCTPEGEFQYIVRLPSTFWSTLSAPCSPAPGSPHSSEFFFFFFF